MRTLTQNDVDSHGNLPISIDEEHFREAEKLLTGKRNSSKEYADVAEYFREAIRRDDPELLKPYLGLLFRSRVEVVEGFFEREWSELGEEQKGLVLRELVGLSVEKGGGRQAAAAQALADKDSESASFVLFHYLGGNKRKTGKSSKGLSKEKSETLRNRFFTSTNNWKDFDSAQPEILKTILLTFCLLFDESDLKGPGALGVTFRFAKWATDRRLKLKLTDVEASAVESSLKAALKSLPEGPRRELLQGRSQIVTASVPTSEKVEARDSKEQVSGVSDSERVTAKEKVPDKPESSAAATKPEAAKSDSSLPPTSQNSRSRTAPFRSAEELLAFKRESTAYADAEINLISKLIDERNAALARISSLYVSTDKLADEAEVLRLKVKDLTDLLNESESRLSAMQRERDKAVGANAAMAHELSGAKNELKRKTSQLESERTEFAASSVERANFETESYRGALRQKLRPIFENKRQTDSFEPDAQLASFLRGWFTEIEEVLRKNGINP